MNTRRLLSALLLIGFGGCASQAPPDLAEGPVGPVAVAGDLDVRPLGSGVWLHTTWRADGSGGRTPSNGLIVARDGKLWLVDTAWGDEPTRALLDWVEGVWGRAPDAVIATHHHDDRLSGVGELRARGVRVVAHPRTIELAPSLDPEAVTSVEGVATPGAAVTVGPFEVFYPGPGHAEDNVVVWLPDGILFGGCAVRPAGSASPGYVADADPSGWVEAMDRLERRYGEAAIVVPGHGPPGGPSLFDHTRRVLLDHLGVGPGGAQ